jgi:hypothetical protein
MERTKEQMEGLNQLGEEQAPYVGFIHKSEDEKLKEDVFRSAMEKLHLFTQMLHRETILNKAKIIKP